jgi:hypothetical protein
MNTIQQDVCLYIRPGWGVVPILDGEKRPVSEGWPSDEITEENVKARELHRRQVLHNPNVPGCRCRKCYAKREKKAGVKAIR